MRTADSKTISVATSQKANQPFFSKEGEGNFFGKSADREFSFFKPSSAYTVNGNGVLQTRLTIGQPNDKYEKEADVMADKVVQRMATPGSLTKKDTGVQAKPLAAGITPLIQTKCAACESASAKASTDKKEKLQKKEEVEEKDLVKDKLQKKPIFESNAEPSDDEGDIQRKCAECEMEEKLQKKDEENLVRESPLELQCKPIFESNEESSDDDIQRKCAECEKEEALQTKPGSSEPSTASPDVENNLNSTRGSGSLLPSSTKSQMENSFGTDFSKVRIHNDSTAVQMNKNLNAKAFTHGNDIYFNSGNYDENSNSGKHLLAHELTHVVQQGKAEGNIVQQQPANVSNVPSANQQVEPAKPQVPPILFAMDTAVRPPAVYFSVAFPGYKLTAIANYLYGREEAAHELQIANPGLGDFAQAGQAIKPLLAPLTPAAASLLDQNTKSGSVLRTLGVPTTPQKELVVYSVSIPGAGDFKVTEQQFIALLNGSILWVGRKAAYYSELIRDFKKIRDEFLDDRNSVVGGISDWLGDVSPPDAKYWNDPIKLADSIVLDLRGWKGKIPLNLFSASIDQDKDLVQDIFRESNIPLLQVRLRENLALLVRVAEGEQIVNRRWHNFIEGTISGAGVAASRLEIVRNVSFGIAAGLAGAVAAPAVFAAAGTGLASVGVTGTAATVLSGGAAIGGGAGAGALLQGSLNVVAPGLEADKSAWDRFKSGAKKGAVSGGIGGAGALVAPGVSGAIGSKLFGAGAEVALTGTQQMFVNVLTGITVGAPAGFTSAAIENFGPWMNGEITLGEFFKRCGYSAAIGGAAGGALAFIPINGLYKSGGQPFNPFSGQPVLPRFMLAGPWSPIQPKWSVPPEFNALPPSQLPNLPEGYAWARIGGQWEPISLKGPFGEAWTLKTGTDPNGNIFYDVAKGGGTPTIRQPWTPGPSIKGGKVTGGTTGTTGTTAPRAQMGGGGAEPALKIVPEPLIEPEPVIETPPQPALKQVPKYVPGQSKVVKPGTNVGPMVGGIPAVATGEKKKGEEDKNNICYHTSRTLRVVGRRYLESVGSAPTPEDLRLIACIFRTFTGTTDNHFKKINVAVGRFLVGNEMKYVVAANRPGEQIHSEDEVFRSAERRFGVGKFKLDALFSERVPCDQCSGWIPLFPRTPGCMIYCITNDYYTWTQIRDSYNNGVLF